LWSEEDAAESGILPRQDERGGSDGTIPLMVLGYEDSIIRSVVIMHFSTKTVIRAFNYTWVNE